jgi:hypothetical protein
MQELLLPIYDYFSPPGAGAYTDVRLQDLLRALPNLRKLQVRKTPSWPRSWANFSFL